MRANSQTYRSYLLRLWRVDEDGCQVWRASLEDPRTGERRGFPSMNALVEFLRELIRKKEEENSTARK